MPRAPSKCLEPGCLRAAQTKGRCPDHYQPWSTTSPRNRTRPRNAGSLVRRVRRRDRETCYVCGAPGSKIVDHIVPVSQGGTWDLTNLACICDSCHRAKSAREAASGRNRKR